MATPPEEEISWRVREGLDRRAVARRAYGKAIVLETLSPAEAEASVREALARAASALNWLEGTEHEDRAHAELDEMGRFAREHFPGGCHLSWDGSRYTHRCPVRIAHKRIGFSMGFRTKAKVCSICGGDFSECEHIPSRRYMVRGGPGPSGYCPVCVEKDCTEHSAEREYEVAVVSIVTELEIEEVSLVARPRQPDARLTEIPIDTDQLKRALGPRFKPGMPVTCDKCLEACEGLERPYG